MCLKMILVLEVAVRCFCYLVFLGVLEDSATLDLSVDETFARRGMMEELNSRTIWKDRSPEGLPLVSICWKVLPFLWSFAISSFCFETIF